VAQFVTHETQVAHPAIFISIGVESGVESGGKNPRPRRRPLKPDTYGDGSKQLKRISAEEGRINC
jgi:hypothetical protein